MTRTAERAAELPRRWAWLVQCGEVLSFKKAAELPRLRWRGDQAADASRRNVTAIMGRKASAASSDVSNASTKIVPLSS